MDEGAKIQPNVYLFRHAVKRKGKKGKKKKVEASAQSTSSNAPLTLLKRKRVGQPVEAVATNSDWTIR